MKYFDIETQELLTLADLNRERNRLIHERNIEPMSLDDYVKACLGKNGTLVQVYENV